MVAKSAKTLAYMKTQEYRRECKRRDIARARGVKLTVPAAPIQAALRYYIDVCGVTRGTLAARTGVSVSSIQHHYRGYAHKGPDVPLTTCFATFEAKIRQGLATITTEDWTYPAAEPIRRRVHALVAGGYTLKWIGEQTGRTTALIHGYAHATSKRTYADFATAIIALYAKYEQVDPMDLGFTSHATTYAKTVARKHGWAPASCWDVDTIDDLTAMAEWTGRCGTEAGYRIHHRESIPICGPCKRGHYDFNHKEKKPR